MIDPATGRFDWMEWIPGPPELVYPGRNTLEFYIPHDMAGYYNGGGPPGVMLDPNRSASWPYTIGETKAFQHYPIWSPCWTSGSEYWNRRGIAPETVRTVRPLQNPAEPLSPIQVEMHMRAIHDIEEYRVAIGLPPITFRRSLGTIKEHREVSPVPTSCPSGRMQPLYDALEEHDDMTPEQVQQMIDAALEKRDAEYAAAVGAKPIRHAQAVNARLWAIHRDTDPKQVPGDTP